MTPFHNVVFKRCFALVMATLLAAIWTTGSFAQTSTTVASGVVKPAIQVDVNSADLKTLQTLPGVGPATAKKIIDGRPYKSLADLGRIKGLSEAKLKAIKDLVIFGPATAVQTPSAAPAPPTKLAAVSTASATNAAATSTAAASRLAPGQKLNINTASAADLDKLPGIGAAKSQAIVDYRTQNGPFKSIEDIQKVKGIKAGVFSKLKDYIKVSD